MSTIKISGANYSYTSLQSVWSACNNAGDGKAWEPCDTDVYIYRADNTSEIDVIDRHGVVWLVSDEGWAVRL